MGDLSSLPRAAPCCAVSGVGLSIPVELLNALRLPSVKPAAPPSSETSSGHLGNRLLSALNSPNICLGRARKSPIGFVECHVCLLFICWRALRPSRRHRPESWPPGSESPFSLTPGDSVAVKSRVGRPTQGGNAGVPPFPDWASFQPLASPAIWEGMA